MGFLEILGITETDEGSQKKLRTVDELPQKEPVIVSKEFVVKYKYSYFGYKGEEQFFLVSQDETIYQVYPNIPFNIYVWKTAEIDDRIKVMFNQPTGYKFTSEINRYEFVKKREREKTMQ